ncbi:MAG: cytochrome c oxidase subunit 3 [Acetobacteraceae bacterium]
MSDAAVGQRPLAIGPVGRSSLGWWGLLCFIVTEASLFAYLFFAYFYFAVQLGDNWLPAGPPSFRFSLPAVIVLIISGVAAWWAERGVRRGVRRDLLLGLLIAFLLGLAFIALQLLEWRSKSFTLHSSEYGSVFFIITAFHLAHLAAGELALLVLLAWSGFGYFDIRRTAPVLIGTAYWYFVVVVGIVMFMILYVTPYLR